MAKKAATAKTELTAQDKLNAVGIEEVCRLTAECIPQRTIAANIGVSWATFVKWIDDDQARSEHYARAREAQADKLAEDILAIADDGRNDTYLTDNGAATNQDVIARSRLRVDARKWLASKMAPKKYGEKVDLTHANPDGTALNLTVNFK